MRSRKREALMAPRREKLMQKLRRSSQSMVSDEEGQERSTGEQPPQGIPATIKEQPVEEQEEGEDILPDSAAHTPR